MYNLPTNPKGRRDALKKDATALNSN